MSHTYYSLRKGTNPNVSGLPLADVINLFVKIFDQLREDGYFHESFGYECVDAGYIDGRVRDIEVEILLTVRKKDLWPIHTKSSFYSEDDLFDVIEFLYQYVSKPLEGSYHGYSDCGMHWETFNKAQGQAEYRDKVNTVLGHYDHPFELSPTGEVLHRPEFGFEQIIESDIPSEDSNITGRFNAAVRRYLRHGSNLDDRRQAVRDLADVLEYLRPKMKSLLTSADEKDLFNLVNNFGVRHHNNKQKTGYDAELWFNWMFYFFLATIHVVLRKQQQVVESSK